MKAIVTVILALGLSPFAFAAGTAAAGKSAADKTQPGFGSPEAVEKRIAELHSKLKITEAQESLWAKVTQEMHDSAKAMHELNEKREQDSKTMSAIDDLRSYSEIAALHAESMKKFLIVFTPLYNAMTDDQQKNADEIFRGHKEAKRAKK